MQYKKAPISEVIFGITFNESPLLTNNDLYPLISLYKEEFSKIEYFAPLVDQELVQFNLINSLNPENTGQVLFRLRTSDKKWLIQMQGNKIYMNWIRGDKEEPGNYPGYSSIYKKFLKIFKQVESKLKKPPTIKSLELTYQDRIDWQSYVSSLKDIKQILNLDIILTNDEASLIPNIVDLQYAIAMKEINGHGILAINNKIITNERNLLSVQLDLKGSLKGETIEEWFNEAHNLQLRYFHTIFSKNILEKWI